MRRPAFSRRWELVAEAGAAMGARCVKVRESIADGALTMLFLDADGALLAKRRGRALLNSAGDLYYITLRPENERLGTIEENPAEEAQTGVSTTPTSLRGSTRTS